MIKFRDFKKKGMTSHIDYLSHLKYVLYKMSMLSMFCSPIWIKSWVQGETIIFELYWNDLIMKKKISTNVEGEDF